MKAVAIIPARGGSKRIPQKNIKPFCGLPIIAYPLKLALQSGIFERVVVSTDSAEVAAVALKLGAEVVDRPADLANDHSALLDVMVHEARRLNTPGGPDYLCYILATAVFLSPDELRRGANAVESGGFCHALTAVPFASPVQRAFVQTTNGGTRMLTPDSYKRRSQDFPTVYHDAGQCYWGKIESFINGMGSYFGDTTTIIPMAPHSVIDIDTEGDWQMAEAIFRTLNGKKN